MNSDTSANGRQSVDLQATINPSQSEDWTSNEDTAPIIHHGLRDRKKGQSPATAREVLAISMIDISPEWKMGILEGEESQETRVAVNQNTLDGHVTSGVERTISKNTEPTMLTSNLIHEDSITAKDTPNCTSIENLVDRRYGASDSHTRALTGSSADERTASPYERLNVTQLATHSTERASNVSYPGATAQLGTYIKQDSDADVMSSQQNPSSAPNFESREQYKYSPLRSSMKNKDIKDPNSSNGGNDQEENVHRIKSQGRRKTIHVTFERHPGEDEIELLPSLTEKKAKISLRRFSAPDFWNDTIAVIKRASSVARVNERQNTAGFPVTEDLPLTSIIQLGSDSSPTAKELQSQSRTILWFILDLLGSYLWVGPLVVLYWNSTWLLYDHYIYKDDLMLTSWISAAVGFPLFVLATLFKTHIEAFSKRRCRPVRYVVMRVHSYIMGAACVHQWRAVWLLQDYYLGVSILNAALSFSVSVTCLVLCRCLKVTCTPPVSITLDTDHSEHYKMDTFGRRSPGTFLFVLDAFLTVCVIHSLGISSWRAFWELLDLVLYPDVPLTSGIWSLVISYSLALILVTSQEPAKRVSKFLQNVHWLIQLVFEDVITLLYLITCITHWRGFWLVIDAYSPPRPASLWAGHCLSFLLLALGMAANSIQGRGCPRDGDQPDGQGVVPGTIYFSALLKSCRGSRVKSPLPADVNHSHSA